MNIVISESKTMKTILSFLITFVVSSSLLGSSLALAAPQESGKYKINVNDTLTVEVLEDSSLNRALLVAPDGRITLPLAGTFSVHDKTIEEITNIIAKRLASNFAVEPTVIVTLQDVSDLGQQETTVEGGLITVYALGDVLTPGPILVRDGTNLLQALSLVGGFSRFAATKRIQLRRSESQTEEIIEINYNAITKGQSNAGLIQMQDGDVILVPQRHLFE